MRKVKEVLRLRLELGLGQRAIARSCGMGLSTVHDYLERAAQAGLSWPLAEGLAKRNWKRSCLVIRFRLRGGCEDGQNRFGRRCMSNCSSIVI